MPLLQPPAVLAGALRRQEDLPRGRIGEEQRNIGMQARLIVLHREEIVPTSRPQLPAQRLLTVQGIATHHPSAQVRPDLLQQPRRHAQLRLLLGLLVLLRGLSLLLFGPDPPLAPAPGRPRGHRARPTEPRATPPHGCPATPCRPAPTAGCSDPASAPPTPATRLQTLARPTA